MRIGWKVPGIYVWSILFLTVVYFFSFVLESENLLVYAVYFVFALPYYRHIEKFALICYILSTIAFFFCGADESIWSLYTLFCFVVVINRVVTNSPIIARNIVPMVFMLIPVWISYNHSQFQYIQGAVLFTFNIVIGVFVALNVDFDRDQETLEVFFPLIACYQALLYFVAAMMSETLTTYGATLVPGMNHNAFGISAAQIGTIIAVRFLLYESKHKNIEALFLLLSFVTTFVTGSRNAFLGLTVAIVATYIYKQKITGKVFSGAFKFILVIAIILIIALNVVPLLGFDISRYNYVDVISSGGSNRTYLWTLIIPLIINKYMIYGYGPSHFCSQQVVTPLVGRNYVHTHNLFIEAWGELGLLGLIPFCVLVLFVIKKTL